MNKLTLRKAVEELCADGDPIEIASLRILDALKRQTIRSWGLWIEISANWELKETPDQKIDEISWSYLDEYNWRESAIRPAKELHSYQSEWNWHAATRIELSREDFDGAFFPHKAANKTVEHTAVPVGGACTWLDRAIPLRKAVELLHEGGDPIDAAIIRIRSAAGTMRTGRIRSWGLAVGFDASGPPGEYFEDEQEITPYCWNHGGRVDWEHSTIEMAESQQYEEDNGCYYMYFCRIVLNREDFDRVFFPDRVIEPAADIQPSISRAALRKWMDVKYDGARPRVHDLEAAAKAEFGSRVTRSQIRDVATEKWGEPTKGRPRITK
jgi:hypothetical protein